MANVAVFEQVITEDYALYHGDCCEVIKGIKAASVGLSVFSPPFAELYAYSDSAEDMGNSRSYEEFFRHFAFLVSELARVMQPGRIVAVHCIDVPAMKERDGYIGLKDFPGDIIRAFQKEGFIYHSRHTIWKDPLTEATRTKALGLAHKQLCKDSAMCRAGLPDYLLGLRAPGVNQVPIAHDAGFDRFVGERPPEGKGIKLSHNIWRRYASPIWMDIDQGMTLNRQEARDEKDEKHICPLQLQVIERAVELWSNPGEVVASWFAGIGSEGYVAVKSSRRFIGVELKDSYYRAMVRNLARAIKQRENGQGVLFVGRQEESETPLAERAGGAA